MNAVVAKNLSKRFALPAVEKNATLKETIVRGLLRGFRPGRTVVALDDVSFTVARGETLAVLGRNGSGKTTLLRLLAGVFAPDSGSVRLEGSLAPLLALGAGFHPDLTGRENVRIELLVMGLTPREIGDRMRQIAGFAEIDTFLDVPMRTYSAGMAMRLAFATAMSVDPDVLLLDEVLSVGDQAFAAKCLARIDDFKARGKAIVLATHDTNTARERCDAAIWLDRGRVAAAGPSGDVVEAYRRSLASATNLVAG